MGERPTRGWTETDSRTFIDDGAVFVPGREEQIATLRALIPAGPGEAFTVAELGAGGGVAFARFEAGGWNFYRGTPDACDQPSRLDDQLRWLGEAGLAPVDCFWMRAGHAVFGGWRPRRAPANAPGLTSRRGR